MVEFIYLQAGERPPSGTQWLLIVKTHGHDYEVIVSDGLEVTTLGSEATLRAAQDRASEAAASLKIETVYVIGATGA